MKSQPTEISFWLSSHHLDHIILVVVIAREYITDVANTSEISSSQEGHLIDISITNTTEIKIIVHNALNTDYLYEQSEGDWETLWQNKTL